jgi:multidrug efflux pump subunit AcrA (membrane-fusion protein)
VDSRQYLFDLEDNHLLRLEVAVPETYCTAILEDKNITFTVPSMPEKVYKATFSRRSNALTENTRNELWQFDFLNQANVLKSGMYANVQMNLIRSDSTFVVPMSALITGTEKQYVIIVDSDTARFVPVQTGFYFSDKVEVFGPLRTGDFILHPATDKIAQGERIHLMEKPK